MANFNLIETSVTTATHHNSNSNNGSAGNKRRVCNFCQRTYHRNSLIRHQKICANRSPAEGDVPKKMSRGRVTAGDQRDGSFKENQVLQRKCKLLQEGDPPKLEDFRDICDTSGESDFSNDNIFTGPPTLSSVDTEKNVQAPGFTKSKVMNGDSQTPRKPIRAAALVASQKIVSSTNIITNLFSTTSNQSLPVSTTNIVNRDSAIVGSQLEPYSRPSKHSDQVLVSKPKKTQHTNRRLSSHGKCNNKDPTCKAQKRERRHPSGITTPNTKASVVLNDTGEDEESSLTCHNCSVTFENRALLQSHGLKYIASGTLVCLVCSNKKIENLDNHFKEDHQLDKKKIVCSLCNVAVDKNHHFYHFKEHHCVTKKLKCNVCSREFGFMQCLLVHKSNDHLKELHNAKYCQRNGDMMATAENNDKSEKSISDTDCSKKSKYTRRYGAPPPRRQLIRNIQSSEFTKCNGNNETATHNLGARSASLTALNETVISAPFQESPTESNQDSVTHYPPLKLDQHSILNSEQIDIKPTIPDCGISEDAQGESAKIEKTGVENLLTGVEKLLKVEKEEDLIIKIDAVDSLPSSPAPASPALFDVYKDYTCRNCPDRFFESRYKYLRHLKEFHHWTPDVQMDPDYEPELWCPECGHEFVVRPTLMKHLIIAHDDVTNVEDYMERVGYGARPLLQFQCSVCFNIFESEDDLSLHRRSHGLAYLKFLAASSRF